MKTKITFLTLFLTISLFGNSQIDEGLKNLILKDGATYVAYGHKITQEFGEWEYRNSVTYGPITNIAYQTFSQIMYLVRDSAKVENWDQARYRKSADYFRKNCLGGRIILYVERFDYYFSNLKFFFAIIRDSTEKNIFEYQFPYRAADFKTTERYSNWGYVNLPADPGNKFFVYINHKETTHLSDHKFLVEKNPLFWESARN